jgi:hypothetical protein
MSEESRFRAPRPHGQPQPQPATAATSRVRRTEDPLAELARLIGQEDPFAEFVAQRPADPRASGNLGIQRRTRPADGRGYDGRPAERRRPPARTPEPSLDDADHHEAPEPTRGNGRGAYAYGGFRAPRAEDLAPVTARSSREDSASTRPQPSRHERADAYREHERPAARTETRHARRAPLRQDDDPAYDSYSSSDYDPDYAEDAYLPAHGDEFYDEAPRRRLRPWLLAGVAAVAVVVVGTSGLFAYRAIFGVSNTGTPPATIRAEAGPTKVAPGSSTKSSESGSNKQIYDRVGGDTHNNERIVSREERPIEGPNNSPVPSPGRMPGGGTVAAVPQALTPPGPAPVPQPTASTEPRRVRTVTVRADGSVVPEQNRVATPPATAQRPGNTPLALNNTSGNLGPAAPAARPSNTAPAAPQSDNPWASVTSSNQLSAPVATNQAALAPQATAPANPAPIVAVNTPPPAGSYVVQVAAQKTEADAAATWQQLQQKYSSVLGGQQASIRRVDLGERGVFYRAQVGPFGSRGQASEVCQSLKAAGGECVIQRN